MEYRLQTTTHIPLAREQVFAFFADPANLGRITPPELGFRIRTALPIHMGPGTLIDYTIKLWGIPMTWRTRIAEWNPGESFVDEQLSGPYKSWVHTHRFRSVPDGTVIEDDLRYELPFGVLGRIAAPIVRWQVARIFQFREATIARLLGPAQSL
jgi:ligand-binding SRPBCC domain-containing protein